MQQAKSLPELKQCCADFTTRLGFVTYSFCLKITASVDKPKLLVITDFPQAWIDAYTEQKLFSLDPIMLKADQFNQAYTWEEIGLYDEVDPQILAAAAHLGIVDGVSAPFFGFTGEAAVLSIVVPERLQVDDPRILPAKMLISWFTAALFQKAVTLFESYYRETNTTLTSREKDCLRLAAAGFTAAETASELFIGETTVVHHLRNAGVKLEARRRLDTVTKAMACGALTYSWQDAADIDIEVL